MQTTEFNKLQEDKKPLSAKLKRLGPIALIIAYEALLLAFLLVEMGVISTGSLRATNQVLMLVALVFLPFVIMALSSALDSLRLNLQGNEMEMQFKELKKQVDGEMSLIKGDISSRLGDSQQVLFTILGGPRANASERAKSGPLKIGTKGFRSSRLFAHYLKEKLEVDKIPVPVEVIHPNGSTLNNFSGLLYGHIDAYVEYTGTICQILGIDQRDKQLDTLIEEINKRSSPHGIRWLAPLGVHDNYFLVMLREVAEKRGIQTFSQLATHSPELVFSTYTEFFGRNDGFVGLKDTYGFNFKSVENRGVSGYSLLENGETDVCIGWESDIECNRSDRFALLEDDKAYFPTYMALPAVRSEVLDTHPEIENAWNALANTLETDCLRNVCQTISNQGDRKEDYERAARECLHRPNSPVPQSK